MSTTQKEMTTLTSGGHVQEDVCEFSDSQENKVSHGNTDAQSDLQPTENTSLSPIAWLRTIRPNKPPQFAYQLLKQGLPHTIILQANGKEKPMIPPHLFQEAEEFLLSIEDAQSSRKAKKNQGNSSAASPREQQAQITPAQQSIQRSLHSKTSHLALYERLPGIITVALLQNPTSPEFIRYKNALDQLPADFPKASDKFLSSQPHFMSYDTLQEHLRSRRILLDSSRNIMRLLIESLRNFPVFESDLLLADELASLLLKHPEIAPSPREEDLPLSEQAGKTTEAFHLPSRDDLVQSRAYMEGENENEV